MRVKLQLVMCNDEGHEETVTDVITLNKNNQRIEHLGLTLSEANNCLAPPSVTCCGNKLTPFLTRAQIARTAGCL